MQRVGIFDGGAVAKGTGSFNGFSIAIAFTPTPQRVVVLQGNTEGIDPGMAVDTGGVTTVCRQALTDGQSIRGYVICGNRPCVRGRRSRIDYSVAVRRAVGLGAGCRV